MFVGEAMSPEHVLIAYGSLKPGEANHHVVSGIHGDWIDGTIRGEMGSWGAYLLYAPNPDSPTKLPVQILISDELPSHWSRLDAFEGEAYERIVCDVETARGVIQGYVYAKPNGAKRQVRQDQFRGALLGLAWGDAVGIPEEWRAKLTLRARIVELADQIWSLSRC